MSPFRRLQVHSSRLFWCLPPVGDVGSVSCAGFLLAETGACFLMVGLDLVLLVGRAASGDVFWGVCELSMTLGTCLLIGGVVFLSR